MKAVTPIERQFKKQYAADLLEIARQDLQTAEALIKAVGIRPENILYHLEQAIEKSLKAVLCHQGKPVPLHHVLFGIIQRFPDTALPPGGYALVDLTPFATIRRYVIADEVIEQQEVAQALDTAKEVVDWATEKIGSKGKAS